MYSSLSSRVLSQFSVLVPSRYIRKIGYINYEFFYGNKLIDVTGGIIFISTFKQVLIFGNKDKRLMSPTSFIDLY